MLPTLPYLCPELPVYANKVWSNGKRRKEKGERKVHQSSHSFHLVHLSQVVLIPLRASFSRAPHADTLPPPYRYSWRLKPIVDNGGKVKDSECERPCQAIGSACWPPQFPRLLP